MALRGGYPKKDTVWTTDIDVSEIRGLSEPFRVDPSLPVVGIDPRNPEDTLLFLEADLPA